MNNSITRGASLSNSITTSPVNKINDNLDSEINSNGVSEQPQITTTQQTSKTTAPSPHIHKSVAGSRIAVKSHHGQQKILHYMKGHTPLTLNLEGLRVLAEECGIKIDSEQDSDKESGGNSQDDSDEDSTLDASVVSQYISLVTQYNDSQQGQGKNNEQSITKLEEIREFEEQHAFELYNVLAKVEKDEVTFKLAFNATTNPNITVINNFINQLLLINNPRQQLLTFASNLTKMQQYSLLTMIYEAVLREKRNIFSGKGDEKKMVQLDNFQNELLKDIKQFKRQNSRELFELATLLQNKKLNKLQNNNLIRPEMIGRIAKNNSDGRLVNVDQILDIIDGNLNGDYSLCLTGLLQAKTHQLKEKSSSPQLYSLMIYEVEVLKLITVITNFKTMFKNIRPELSPKET